MMKQTFFDSHAHLDFEEFDQDRQALFLKMKAQGIDKVLIPGVSPDRWSRQLDIANQYQCFFGLGIHPWFIPQDLMQAMVKLEQQIINNLTNPLFVAIGECGLDKLRPNFSAQIDLCYQQLILAKKYQLPVIIHAVKCHSELIALLAKTKLTQGGVIHGFYGSVEVAKQYQFLGFKLGIGGLILNSSAKKLHQVVTELPLETFVIETDSPSMAPLNSTEKRNTPIILPSIIEKIAFLRKKSTVPILEQVNKNTLQLYEL
ncbi:MULTISPECIES: TatD family hydrolase [Pseudomonadati]|uniref:TatD family hydrolase n=1 Tax=Shewanella aestuarii TaxID=1028752 RepID=A0ABT0L1A1_9GAMM|nr:TatD family hydrolase [Shewanella aestuarii]MCL1117245.1 TatD family hydrolase [Shewanella aestuarii]GGN74305.1 hydrolase TatD family protein [Shewanella aestuarii]